MSHILLTQWTQSRVRQHRSALTRCEKVLVLAVWTLWRSSLRWHLKKTKKKNRVPQALKRAKLSYLHTGAAGEDPHPGWEPPGQAAGSWTDSCNTPAVPLWSSRGHCQNSPQLPAGPASLTRKPAERDRNHNTHIIHKMTELFQVQTLFTRARAVCSTGGLVP